ncbi:MAG: type I-B CRISPR-associated protein Cas8b1/Cst1 [Lachnospiraceae bacterium]|nr:type I-B CRISPR-associated protein Cas8b1/Cst1 [Lachnospiraceae bacterium]
MDKITILPGDFLKNAGIVGLWYMLEESDAEPDSVYGLTDDKQGLWIEREFMKQADWTGLYFKAFVKRYGSLTVYRAALDKIEAILEKAEHTDWSKADCKEDLKFINEKLLSNSYRSGFENIRQDIENPEVYELLKTSRLKENMEKEELCGRLRQLHKFLEQPLCEETFSMKSIVYNYINRFWDGKSFLLRANAAKDMKMLFDVDFSEPLRKYAANNHEKAKEMCIDCSGKMDAKEKVSVAFMKDQADDLTRKRSAFWNCKVDAWLCPVCAFVYSLVPLGFTLVGRTFVFINMNRSVKELLDANSLHGKLNRDSEKDETERYSSWIARTIDLLLQEKSKELGNIQVVARGMGESDRYTFDVIAKDVLRLLNDSHIRQDLDRLSQYPYIKIGKDYWNIHENVILNLLRYRNQYTVINKLLKMAIENESNLIKAVCVYDIQLRTRLLSESDGTKIGGKLMNRYGVRDEGYELRKALLKAKGASDDACIRGTIYQLLNALSVGNVEHFMEVIMRVYCSTRLQVPNVFIEFLKDRDTFVEYGYAFLLGLQGSHYEKKEEKLND